MEEIDTSDLLATSKNLKQAKTKKANYTDLEDSSIASLENITEVKEVETEEEAEKNKEIQGTLDGYHNFFINFFLYIKEFLNYTILGGYDARTSQLLKIKHFSFNFGSKTYASKLNYDQETYEYPIAKINILDIRPFDSNSQIQRRILGLEDNIRKIILADNITKQSVIMADLSLNYVNANIEIQFEDSSDIINFQNMILNILPLNKTVQLPEQVNTINLTNIIRDLKWQTNDKISNIIISPNNTWTDQDYVYGLLYQKPLCELQNINFQQDKEGMRHTMNIDILFTFLKPVKLFAKKYRSYKKIVLNINNINNDIIVDSKPLLTNITNEEIINVDLNDITKININNNIYMIENNDNTIGDTTEQYIIKLFSDIDFNNFSLWYSKVRSINEYDSNYYFDLAYLKNKLITKEIEVQSFDNLDKTILELPEDLQKESEVFYKIVLKDIDNNIKYFYIIKSRYILTDVKIYEYFSVNLLIID